MINSVLVFGGAGFIGTHLVDVLRSTGRAIWVYDNFSSRSLVFTRDICSKNIIYGDILDSESVRTSIANARPDVVYHLAAVHHIPTCEKRPELAYRTNVEGTEVILNACREFSVPRIIFASSGAVYDVKDGPLDECSPVKARDVYGRSKLAGERLVAEHSASTNAEVIVARLFNCVGCQETTNHLVPEIINQVATGHREIRLGNLQPRRDYLHVQDAAAGLAALSQISMPRRFEIFNVASGVEHSVADLVMLLSEIINESLLPISDPERFRQVDRISQLGDSRKLQKLTSWLPHRGLRRALEDAWKEKAAQGLLKGKS